MRLIAFLMCAATAVGCDRPSHTEATHNIQDPAGSASVSQDTSYSAEWNMGENPDEPDSSIDTRFRVRVVQLRSGSLRLWLDTSRAGLPATNRVFYPADSVQVDGLTPVDRFTQGCTYGSGPWQPRVGVVSDTIIEHNSRPKVVWFLDTASVRIRQLPTDSASCFVAGPD
jgi:hypothetical protein